MRDGMIPIKAGIHPTGNGTQAIHEFPNGYGASVIRNSWSYGGTEGLYELAVLHYTHLCYSTYITNDVIGYLSEAEVVMLLERIADLPKDEGCNHMQPELE